MEMYRCKKCGAEFPKPDGLKEYRAHCLKCKTAHESEENEQTKETSVREEKKAEIVDFNIGRIKAENKCRGNYEGNRDEICKHYITCADCWADYRG